MLKILTTLITRIYMLSRLQVEPLLGVAICFLVRGGASGKEKKY
mgnify:CR=1 FL=1